MKKRAVNPTGLYDYACCPYRYYVIHILGYGPAPSVKAKRELGTLVHAAETAVEMGEGKAFIEDELKKLRTRSGYKSVHTPMLERLKLEAIQITDGHTWMDGKGKKMTSQSYHDWTKKEIEGQGYEFADIEERYWVDVGPIILAPRLDRLLIDDKDQYWPYEVKLTGRWDDAIWQDRWKLDGQTTLQAIAVEKKYGVEVPGVMVEAIQHTRQSSTKEENKKKLMPISKVQRFPLKWVRKPREVLTHAMSWLEEVGPEMDERERSGNWPLSGMIAKTCDLCTLRQHCIGNLPLKQLHIQPMNEIRKWNEKRKLK